MYINDNTIKTFINEMADCASKQLETNDRWFIGLLIDAWNLVTKITTATIDKTQYYYLYNTEHVIKSIKDYEMTQENISDMVNQNKHYYTINENNFKTFTINEITQVLSSKLEIICCYALFCRDTNNHGEYEPLKRLFDYTFMYYTKIPEYYLKLN